MKLTDFNRSFVGIAKKPRPNERYMLKIVHRDSQKVLMNDFIGNELRARPGTFDTDRNVIAWWIEYRTIVAIVD